MESIGRPPRRSVKSSSLFGRMGSSIRQARLFITYPHSTPLRLTLPPLSIYLANKQTVATRSLVRCLAPAPPVSKISGARVTPHDSTNVGRAAPPHAACRHRCHITAVYCNTCCRRRCPFDEGSLLRASVICFCNGRLS